MQKTTYHKRKRFVYGIATILVIFVGLASRRVSELFPAVLGKYPGDVLWALMVFVGLGFFWPNASILGLAISALSISYLDEISQFYQAAWINDIRNTALGHLVLGSAFSWFDMLSYTIGVSIGVLWEIITHVLGVLIQEYRDTKRSA